MAPQTYAVNTVLPLLQNADHRIMHAACGHDREFFTAAVIESHFDMLMGLSQITRIQISKDLRHFRVGPSLELPHAAHTLPLRAQCKQLKCVRPFSCRLGAVIGFPITLAVMQSQQPQKASEAK